jgi:hypothetical protein
MKTIVNLIAKFSGAGKVWGKLDGSKTYLGGAVSILSGAAGLLSEILALINAQDTAAVWEFVKHLPADQNILAIAGGLAAVGLRHAIEKKDAPAPAA